MPVRCDSNGRTHGSRFCMKRWKLRSWPCACGSASSRNLCIEGGWYGPSSERNSWAYSVRMSWLLSRWKFVKKSALDGGAGCSFTVRAVRGSEPGTAGHESSAMAELIQGRGQGA